MNIDYRSRNVEVKKLKTFVFLNGTTFRTFKRTLRRESRGATRRAVVSWANKLALKY